MRANFAISEDSIIAEPLYILLSYYGHPDAHEYVRKKTPQAYNEKESLNELIEAEDDEKVLSYMKRFMKEQKAKVFDAEKYTGIAAAKVEKVADYWEEKMGLT
jgi:adenylosuccinate lyase